MYCDIEKSEQDHVDSFDNVTKETKSADNQDIFKTPVGNRILDISILCQQIESSLICKTCHGNIAVEECSRFGLHSEFIFKCENHCLSSFDSNKQIDCGHNSNFTAASINRRSVLAARTIGCDHAELALFCGVMDLPPPITTSTWTDMNKTLEKAARIVQELSTCEAGKLEYAMASTQDDDAGVNKAENAPDDDADAKPVRNIDVSCGMYISFHKVTLIK